MSNDIDYAQANIAFFTGAAILILFFVLWENRTRISKAFKVWCRPDLNHDTPVQYIRNSRRHW
jgi:hypothetical protein